MNRNLLLSLVSICALAFMAAHRLSAADPREQQAQAAAEQWLGLIDAGSFGESWQSAAPIFQKAVSQSDWKASLEVARKPLGTLLSRQLKSARFTKALPGAPDGEYVVLQFKTAFSNKRVAIETVTPMLDRDGKWKVAGYFIK